MINLTNNTILIENQKSEAAVKQIYTNKNPKSTPKYPCWFCGGMHFEIECSYKKCFLLSNFPYSNLFYLLNPNCLIIFSSSVTYLFIFLLFNDLIFMWS